LDVKPRIVALLDDILGLEGRAATFSDDTPLLGALPELDSMAVVAVITGLEEQFGLVIHDDEIEGATFATLGSLVEFVTRKMA
jgi:acyl carrier protein